MGSVWNMAGKRGGRSQGTGTSSWNIHNPFKKFDSGKKRDGMVALRSQIKVLGYNQLDPFIHQEEETTEKGERNQDINW